MTAWLPSTTPGPAPTCDSADVPPKTWSIRRVRIPASAPHPNTGPLVELVCACRDLPPLGSDLGWGPLLQSAMGTHGVVVDAPDHRDLTRFLDRGEPMHIETLIAEPAVERLDHRVVGRFAGAGKDESDTMAIGPGIEGL